jgi:hypothetical protein
MPSRWRRLRSIVLAGATILSMGVLSFGLTATTHAAAVTTLPAPSSPLATNEPIVSTPTVVPTPSWAKSEVGNGKLVLSPNCYQPTAAIYSNPLSLTEAQIQKYGFPQRPVQADAASVADWEYQVEHSRRRFCLGIPTTMSTARITNLAARTTRPIPRNEHGPEYHDWAGYYMSQNSSPGPWQEESMAYTAPTITGISECPTTAVQQLGVWGGLGGVVDNYLAQAGMDDGVTSDSSCDMAIHGTLIVDNTENVSGQSNYQSAYGSGIYVISGTIVDAGDSMQADTFYNAGGSGMPEMYTADYSQTEYYSYEYGPEPSNSQFSCADEQVNDAIIDYDSFDVTSCWGEAGGTEYYPGDNHFAYHEEYNGVDSTDYWYYPSSPPNSSTGAFTLKCHSC